MAQEDFRRSLRLALTNDIERLLRGRFFTALEAGEFSSQGIRRIAAEYYKASEGFPRILAIACSKLATDETRLPIVRNLWDEHGCGDIKRSHRTMLGKFLRYFGVDPDDVKLDSGPAQRYVEEMNLLCIQSAELRILGALGPGCESFTPKEYQVIVGALQRRYGVPPDALEFFLDHIHHDPQHMKDIDDSLSVLVGRGGDVGEIIGGAKAAIEIETRFWDEVHLLASSE